MTESAASDRAQPEAIASEVLDLVRDLALELRPDREKSLRVSGGSSLHRDLGLDSLARTELLLRLEHRFSVGLDDDLLAEAEVVDDLVAAVMGASSGDGAAVRRVRAAAIEPAEETLTIP